MTQDAAPKHYPTAGVPERSDDLMFRLMIAMGLVQAACWITVIVLVLT